MVTGDLCKSLEIQYQAFTNTKTSERPRKNIVQQIQRPLKANIDKKQAIIDNRPGAQH